jgi:hypothetical protein
MKDRPLPDQTHTEDRPRLLAERIAPSPDRPLVRGRVIAWPEAWQVPAATEKAAFAAILPRAGALDFDYLGFAWATLFDGLRSDAPATGPLLRALAAIRALRGRRPAGRCATVAQHIHAARHAAFFRALGVTDLFFSHARTDQPEVEGLRIHPFPLFPAQTPDGIEPGDPHRPRRHLANFVGAYNPKAYLTDVRAHVFADRDAPDLLVIAREAWHFERAVYDEQMRGQSPDAARLALEERHRAEYLDAIRASTFTLCPTGSGPNSIRVGEALALASIPIILTRVLALPGDPALWQAACLFEEDSAEGYARALARARAMPEDEIRRRQAATRALFAATGPAAYADLIAERMQAIR